MKTTLGAIREAWENVELLAKPQGQLQTGTTINVVALLGSQEWQTITVELRTANRLRDLDVWEHGDRHYPGGGWRKRRVGEPRRNPSVRGERN